MSQPPAPKRRWATPLMECAQVLPGLPGAIAGTDAPFARPDGFRVAAPLAVRLPAERFAWPLYRPKAQEFKRCPGALGFPLSSSYVFYRYIVVVVEQRLLCGQVFFPDAWHALSGWPTLCSDPSSRCHGNGDKSEDVSASVDNPVVVPKLSPVLRTGPSRMRNPRQIGPLCL